MTSSSSAVTSLPESDRESVLLSRIAETDFTAAQLCTVSGLSLMELSRWVTRPQTLRGIQGLALLMDLRAQMLVSRYRATAAARLIAIASMDEAGELSRKACVDLLGADLGAFAPLHDPKAPPPPPPAPTPQAILEALERLAPPELRTTTAHNPEASNSAHEQDNAARKGGEEETLKAHNEA